MKQAAFTIFSLLIIICHAQSSKTKTVKPTTNTVVNTNTIGTFFINYEIKKSNQPAKTGKVFYALDNNQIVISPSNSGLKDVTNLRMLVDLKESEMTMLTIDIKNKKSGLLTNALLMS